VKTKIYENFQSKNMGNRSSLIKNLMRDSKNIKSNANEKLRKRSLTNLS
jgi:hypothetical protein